tara:strand:- start:119 stop:577 length:459 start_codon:yes stop_codon:yes gene_type:complete
VRQVIEVDLNGSSEQIYIALADLANYKNWLGFIDDIDTVDIDAGNTCWIVTLRAQIGPFARLKKLRMVRVEEDFPKSIRFSRKETDSKDHSDWDLHVTISEKGDMGCSVQMVVSYSGGFWSVPLQAVFTSHVETAKVRLRKMFSSNGNSSES